MRVARVYCGGKFHRVGDDGEPACGSESRDDADRLWYATVDPDVYGESDLCQCEECFGERQESRHESGRHIPSELRDLDPDDLPA